MVGVLGNGVIRFIFIMLYCEIYIKKFLILIF